MRVFGKGVISLFLVLCIFLYILSSLIPTSFAQARGGRGVARGGGAGAPPANPGPRLILGQAGAGGVSTQLVKTKHILKQGSSIGDRDQLRHQTAVLKADQGNRWLRHYNNRKTTVENTPQLRQSLRNADFRLNQQVSDEFHPHPESQDFRETSNADNFDLAGESRRKRAVARTSHPTRKSTSRTASRPNARPTSRPNARPTSRPNARPTPRPNARPTSRPNARPTPRPNARPTSRPTPRPNARPTPRPNARPTSRPTPRPNARPTPRPNARPTPRPNARPTPRPNARPTSRPTPRPNARPTPRPNARPTPRPNARPNARPTPRPTSRPTPRSLSRSPPRIVDLQNIKSGNNKGIGLRCKRADNPNQGSSCTGEKDNKQKPRLPVTGKGGSGGGGNTFGKKPKEATLVDFIKKPNIRDYNKNTRKKASYNPSRPILLRNEKVRLNLATELASKLHKKLYLANPELKKVTPETEKRKEDILKDMNYGTTAVHISRDLKQITIAMNTKQQKFEKKPMDTNSPQTSKKLPEFASYGVQPFHKKPIQDVLRKVKGLKGSKVIVVDPPKPVYEPEKHPEGEQAPWHVKQKQLADKAFKPHAEIQIMNYLERTGHNKFHLTKGGTNTDSDWENTSEENGKLKIPSEVIGVSKPACGKCAPNLRENNFKAKAKEGTVNPAPKNWEKDFEVKKRMSGIV